MTLAIVTTQDAYQLLVPTDGNKDRVSRLSHYVDWLTQTGLSWHQPDLAAYRDYLLTDRTDADGTSSTLSPSSVKAHLSTIRGQYDRLLRDNSVRSMLFDLADQNGAETPADRKAMVDELLTRIQNGIHPSTAAVKAETKQDRTDADQLRLEQDQLSQLLASPLPTLDAADLRSVRDTAILAVLAGTGIRKAELCQLDVSDLRQRVGGELCLHVRHGKGNKSRVVVWGAMDWALVYVDKWLTMAGVTAGAVFRGIRKDGKTVRKSRISSRNIDRILGQYPVTIDGRSVTVKPHDLRRTYAYLNYLAGMDIVRIQQNLGHAQLDTTRAYIGQLDAGKRRPAMSVQPPHSLHDLRGRWTLDG